MRPLFEEIDYQQTTIGPISLRWRRELRLDVDVMEIILGDEHLMSDLFTTSEKALAHDGAWRGQASGPFVGCRWRPGHGVYG